MLFLKTSDFNVCFYLAYLLEENIEKRIRWSDLLCIYVNLYINKYTFYKTVSYNVYYFESMLPVPFQF